MQLIKSAALVSVIILGAVAGCSSTTTVVTTDAGPTPDAGNKDTGVKDTGPAPDGSTNSCTPQDVSGFTPTAPTPSVPKPATLCTAQNITDYAASCVNPYDKTACDKVNAAAPTCVACLATPDSATKWGALVEGSGVVSVNVAGCYLAKGDTACAASVAAASQCSTVACPDTACPVTDTPSFNAYQACVSSAAKTKCKTYAAAEQACANSDAASAVACSAGTDFASLFTAVATVMCGS